MDDTMRELEALDYMDWLREQGYICVQRTDNGWWVAVERLLFHWSLIAGPMYDKCSITYRYCYQTAPAAIKAMDEWQAKGWEGEPTCWHKRRSLPADLTKEPERSFNLETLLDMLEGLRPVQK